MIVFRSDILTSCVHTTVDFSTSVIWYIPMGTKTWLDVSADECRSASRSRPSHYSKSDRVHDYDFDHEDDIKDTTWRMQGLQLEQQSNANPNDEAVVQSIAVVGHGPGKRAGHTATAVNR